MNSKCLKCPRTSISKTNEKAYLAATWYCCSCDQGGYNSTLSPSCEWCGQWQCNTCSLESELSSEDTTKLNDKRRHPSTKAKSPTSDSRNLLYDTRHFGIWASLNLTDWHRKCPCCGHVRDKDVGCCSTGGKIKGRDVSPNQPQYSDTTSGVVSFSLDSKAEISNKGWDHDADMWTCKQCAAENPDWHDSCPVCGTSRVCIVEVIDT
jgi:hypothetical protein